MESGIEILAAGFGVALAAALVTWLLQRVLLPRLHPIVTTLIAVVFLALITLVGAGLPVLQGLADIGASGEAKIDGPGVSVALMVIYGMLVITLIPIVGLPVALVTAFMSRRRPASD